MSENRTDSLEILKKYLSISHKNSDRYQAHVLGTASGNRSFNAILFVCVQLDSNRDYAEVIIEGNNQYFNYDFKSVYSTDNSTFNLINKTLIIKGKDGFGNDITLEITEK